MGHLTIKDYFNLRLDEQQIIASGDRDCDLYTFESTRQEGWSTISLFLIKKNGDLPGAIFIYNGKKDIYR